MLVARAPVQPQQSSKDHHAKPETERLMCLDVDRGLMVAGMIVVDNPGCGLPDSLNTPIDVEV
jgi:predicted acyltransferase